MRRFSRLLNINLCEFFNIRIMKPWEYVQLGTCNVLHQILRKNLWINWPSRGLIFLRLAIGPIIYINTFGLWFEMTINDKLCKHLICYGVIQFLNNTEDLKTRKDGICQLDILWKCFGGVVPSSNMICSSKNRAPSLEKGNNASLGYTNALLVHCFMDARLVLIIHLVKLINQAGPLIT